MKKELLDFINWLNKEKEFGYTQVGLERIVDNYKDSIHNSYLSSSEIDDYIMEKYKDSEEDFRLLWEEKERYYNFENWWNDFLKYKYELEISKRKTFQ
jgi:hypothetical protein